MADIDVENAGPAPSMTTSARIHPLIRIPPPLLFVFTLFSGIGLHRLAPLTVHSAGIVESVHTAGIGLVGFGILLALSCAGMFLRARTTIVPHGRAAKLVTRGAYRFSRNPM